MAIVTADLMVSLDGFMAGTDVSVSKPGGEGADALHEWIASLASWRERQGLSGGSRDRDSEVIGDWFDATGAVVMGRMMYDTGEAHWGEDPPFRTPVFVLTHRPRPTLVKQGGTSFTFVTEDIRDAVERARAVAGDGNVDIAGGADTVQQALRAGVVDQLRLHVLPVLIGAGLRLFDNLGADRPRLEQVGVAEGAGAAHLTYRVVRP
ncbi:dihydrofolate reductase family protein [Pseudonocardia acaciae]|uniref:dihydrofolate reductase family protein n=1 Tax=Pseudonocardia acaciae TaxID=551276 RepID=UPI00048F9782|nr:dihydrofolate reductase family protein [Pseudonocardia acaciae]